MLSLNEPDDAMALGYAEQRIERGTAIFQAEIDGINNESQVKSQKMAEEIFDIADQIEGYDGPGWWTILAESDSEGANPS